MNMLERIVNALRRPRGEDPLYGHARIIRDYSFYPRFVSLPGHWEHGWTGLDEPLYTDLEYAKVVGGPMLVFSKRRAEAWARHSNIPVIIFGAPFVQFRRMRNIAQKPDARGTVAFVAHSCKGVNTIFDIGKYCDALLELDRRFQPVSCCLHPHDIEKGMGAMFVRRGISVVTAGDAKSEQFVERFYDILSAHKFATSNVVGSYTFYCVEMGVPFFILGEAPVHDNYGGDPNVPRHYSIEQYHVGRIAQDLFDTGPIESISAAQLSFVNSEMGVGDSVSRMKLWFVLCAAKLRCAFRVKYLVKRGFDAAKGRIYGLGSSLRLELYLLQHGLKAANTIYTHMTTEEKIALHRLIKERFSGQRVSCVEIGSYLGASACFIASATSKGSILYCVDTWQNDNMDWGENDSDGKQRDTMEDFLTNTSCVHDKIRVVRAWSKDASIIIGDDSSSIDFLFIDGDHSYEGCLDDWQNYSHLLKEGSIVAFHDTGWAEGVKRVVAERVAECAERILKLPNLEAYQIIASPEGER